MVPIKRYIFTLSNVYLPNLLLGSGEEEAFIHHLIKGALAAVSHDLLPRSCDSRHLSV